MKKPKVSYSTKVRMIAGGAYMGLAVYQMLTLNSVLSNAGFLLLALPVAAFFEIILMLLAGGISVWLFSTRNPISRNLKRGFVFATLFWILYELMSYSAQAQIVSASLGKYLPIISDSALLQYLLLAVRLIIMVFAAFCVLDEGFDEEEEVDVRTLPTVVVNSQKEESVAKTQKRSNQAEAKKETITYDEPEGGAEKEAVSTPKQAKPAAKGTSKSGVKRKAPPKAGTAKKSSAPKSTKE